MVQKGLEKSNTGLNLSSQSFDFQCAKLDFKLDVLVT